MNVSSCGDITLVYRLWCIHAVESGGRLGELVQRSTSVLMYQSGAFEVESQLIFKMTHHPFYKFEVCFSKIKLSSQSGGIPKDTAVSSNYSGQSLVYKCSVTT